MLKTPSKYPQDILETELLHFFFNLARYYDFFKYSTSV
jgi:hypothetical protein